MKTIYLQSLPITLGAAALAAAAVAVEPADAAPPAPPWFTWSTVVNNTDLMPTDDPRCQRIPTPRRCFFNSYNQPSVNVNGLVVIRGRSRGGGGAGGGGTGEQGNQPIHGIYTRDMGMVGGPGEIVRILDRTTEVPQPNNAHYPPSNPLFTTFIETPSFPRIDMLSDTVATRGNHQPVWVYEVGIDPDTGEPIETRAGTTGIYTNPFGDLITGASKLGAVPDFEFFAVPGLSPPTMFDVFPGSPAVTGVDTIVFKGNFTVDNVGKTGVFYRTLANEPIVLDDGTELAPAGGTSPVVLIANNTDTVIPGTDPPEIFGSTSPPSAANGQVVFAGFDNEDAPTLGGIYLAPLAETPELRTLVSIGGRVPGESVKATFNGLGEGGAFDGRYVGFWGAWGTTRTVRLYCPTEGNKDRIAYCNRALYCEVGGRLEEDKNSTCDDTGCWQDKQVPVNQGIFVHDTVGGGTRTVAKTGARFDEFVFWNYSGKTPCTGGGHSEEGAEDDGEPARWRSSAFVAVSGQATAFKAVASGGAQGGCGSCHSGGGVGSAPPSPDHARLVGIYLNRQPGQNVFTVAATGMDGTLIDPEAVYDDDEDPATPPVALPVTELGLEREGLRGDWLAINAKMGIEGGTEEAGMAGIYITRVPRQ